MSNTLYLECQAGISGDMMVAALLDLGADEQVLRNALESLPLDGFRIQIRRVKKAGLDVCDFDVQLDAAHENHDHDMTYLYGHLKMGQMQEKNGHEYHHEHTHGHEHGHHEHEHYEHEAQEDGHHEHEHYECEGQKDGHPEHHHHGHEQEHHENGHHEHGHQHHEHRGMKEITEIIQSAAITEHAKEIALRIFQIIAEAEAKAHGEPVEQVHFHEVGAVDSIVDIVAVAVCLDDLQITDVIVPYLCEGTGSVRCQHGILPVPVPAVVNIAMKNRIALKITNVTGELVTPTGAAIVAAIRTSEQLPELLRIRNVGLGAGKRTYPVPGILRAILLDEPGESVIKPDAGTDEIGTSVK